MSENLDAETLESLYVSDLANNVFEAATKENLQTYQRKFKYGKKPVLIKLLKLFNYWSNQMEKLSLKSSCSRD